MGNSQTRGYGQELLEKEKDVDLDIREWRSVNYYNSHKSKYSILLDKYGEQKEIIKKGKRELERLENRNDRLEDRVSQMSLELSRRPVISRTKQMLIEQRNQQDLSIRELQNELKAIKQNWKQKREHNKKLFDNLKLEEIEEILPSYEAPPLYEEEGKLPNYTNC